MAGKLGRALAGACLIGLTAQAPLARAQPAGSWADPPADLNTGPLSPATDDQAAPVPRRTEVEPSTSRPPPRASRQARSAAKTERSSVARRTGKANRPVIVPRESQRVAVRRKGARAVRTARSPEPAQYEVIEYEVMPSHVSGFPYGPPVRVLLRPGYLGLPFR